MAILNHNGQPVQSAPRLGFMPTAPVAPRGRRVIGRDGIATEADAKDGGYLAYAVGYWSFEASESADEA